MEFRIESNTTELDDSEYRIAVEKDESDVEYLCFYKDINTLEELLELIRANGTITISNDYMNLSEMLITIGD